MDIRRQWFELLLNGQVIFPGKVSADWNSQAIFPVYVKEEDKELLCLDLQQTLIPLVEALKLHSCFASLAQRNT